MTTLEKIVRLKQAENCIREVQKTESSSGLNSLRIDTLLKTIEDVIVDITKRLKNG